MTRTRESVATPLRRSALPIGKPHDSFEREADRAADAVARGEAAREPVTRAHPSSLQRAPHDGRALGAAPAQVDDTLRSNGQPLDAPTRSVMEDRLGFDFGHVRVHTDSQAAESARGVRARAYTVGSNVVFGAGEYAPTSKEGRRLIAHELTHVRQQTAAPPMLQRWNIFNEIAGWFSGDTFDAQTLSTYLKNRDKDGTIEDHSDSDNKARAIVTAWKKDRTAFTLTAKLKALLIKEMQSGFTGDDDEQAILDLLTTATDAELIELFTVQGLTAKSLDSDFHGSESDQLAAFFARKFVGGFEALSKGQVQIKSVSDEKAAAPDAPAAPEVPRDDYVFIMGQDPPKTANPFYSEARKFFAIHYPKATMVTTVRTLEGLLGHIETKIAKPIGNLFVVSHGNQDGTLSFGLNAADLVRDPNHPTSIHGDSRLSPMEVRDALHPASGKSLLPSVGDKIDAKTTVHIRGCDLGQNKEFVNLIDEAFGGKGRVVASTHEQVYGEDSVLGKAAKAKAKKDIEDSEPMPAAVDPAIKDKAAKKAATNARAKALKERQARIDQKLAASKGDIETAGKLAQTYEAMSGVVMQRPGTTLFSEAEVKAEINRRYGHLSDKQRAAFVKAIVKSQKVETKVIPRFKEVVPVTQAQARNTYAGQLAAARFTPDKKQDVAITVDKEKDGTEKHTYRFFDAAGGWQEFSVEGIPVNDDQILKEAQADFPNPTSYTWEVSRKQDGARLTISAVAKRVFVDLHHQSLDAGAHDPFSPDEDNPIFYTWSTYDPKDAAAKSDGKKK
ncbi:MAG: DUF4157 domain-containing protein [Vicinamibacterales bacterium]